MTACVGIAGTDLLGESVQLAAQNGYCRRLRLPRQRAGEPKGKPSTDAKPS
jgi:hypothetical protein